MPTATNTDWRLRHHFDKNRSPANPAFAGLSQIKEVL